jgi:hypothetical protein
MRCHVKTDETVNTIPFLTGVTTMGSFSQVKVGWSAGAGVETPLFGNWTAKAEYLYMDLGNVSGNVVAPQTVIPLNVNPNNVNISENRGFSSGIHDHIFRLGVNYKFDPGAILARYRGLAACTRQRLRRRESRGPPVGAALAFHAPVCGCASRPRIAESLDFPAFRRLTSPPCADKTRALYGRR